MRFFFYGTLMDLDLLNAVTAHRFVQDALQPARLGGWRRVAVRRARYPALVAAEGWTCEGIVVDGIDGRMERRLVQYEGPQYRQAAVDVAVERDVLPARVFLPKVGMPVDSVDWSFEGWQAEHKPDYLRRLAATDWRAT